MKKMRNALQEALLAECEDVIINGDETERLPNTLNIGFKYIDGEALLMMMDAENIAVSAGSACQSGSMEPSYVLRAMNVPLDAIHGSLRFCTSRFTEESEVQEVARKTAAIVKRLREMSPYTVDKYGTKGRLTKAELDVHRQYFASR
jgi:cysteine desulfurase